MMIDFKLNYPSLDKEVALMQTFLHARSTQEMYELLAFPPFQGRVKSVEHLCKLIHFDWRKIEGVSEVVVCNSGNHALSCLFQALRTTHEIIMAEAFSFPAFKLIAAGLQYSVVPVAMDADGLQVESLAEVAATTGAKLLYLQPTIHNPTCATLPMERRLQIVELARAENLFLIEDDAYRFLHPDPPPSFLELAPDRTLHIYSLSKPFNPLIKVAYVVVPKQLKGVLVHQIRLTSSGASSLLMHFADYLLSTGLLPSLICEKQALAASRQKVACAALSNVPFQTHPSSFHLWITLPDFLKASQLTSNLLAKGVEVSSGVEAAFTEAGERHIRVALGAENNGQRLVEGLQLINQAVRV